MNDIELEALLREPESDRAERKSSIADRDRTCEAICAFANDLPNHRGPGIIFVGVKDDGTCADLPVTDELRRSLADLRANGNIIYPFPGMTVQRRKLYGCEMAVIEVMPSDYPRCTFEVDLVRVGPRRDRHAGGGAPPRRKAPNVTMLLLMHDPYQDRQSMTWT